MRALSAVVMLLSACAGAAEPLDAQAGRAALLQGVLDSWAAEPGRHGVTASVILPDGTQWSGAAGFVKGSAPMRPDHLLWVASVTKTMTGAVILQLADEGRLALDDSVSRWLPPLANVDPSITIRQLLNHTSGVNSYAPGALFAASGDSTRVFSPAELATTIGPPVARPGAGTHYTNTAFLLLGWIAERSTGEPLATLFHDRLWDRLGMTETFLAGREPAKGLVADGFLPNEAGPVAPLANLSRASAGHGAGSVFTTARELARWGRALFTGAVVSPRMQAAMRTLVPAAGNIPGESGAGLGIRGYHFLGGLQYGHSGGAVLASSLLVYDPASGAVVALMINRGGSPDHFRLVPELLAIAIGR